MKHLALTLWFTLTTLLGPGVCCCSLAAAPLDASAKSRPAQPAGAPKRVKSCCEHKGAAGAAKVDRATPPAPQQGQPARPTKCPCESEKQVTSLPPKGPAAAPVEQLPALDASPADFDGSRLQTIASVRLALESPVPLAGRNLLAAYSVLRC